MSRPAAVYPAWVYGEQGWDDLEEMLQNPVGEDDWRCKPRRSRPADETPVFGQEHRVVLIDVPGQGTAIGKGAMRVLTKLQQGYPDAIMHLHGAYGYQSAFGKGLAAADVDPRAEASKGRVTLGSGRSLPWEHAAEFAQWVHLNGFTLGDLSVPRNRCIFNIKSALWAGDHFHENINFRSRRFKYHSVSPDDPEFFARPTKRAMAHRIKPKPFDKIACDSCSLRASCKYHREGGICSIPESEMAELAKFFKTRDSDTIIEGLGELMAIEADRVQRGIERETADDVLDPEVTKIVHGMMNAGVKLAKLVNPALAAAGAPRTNVLIQNQLPAGQPNVLMAAAVAELEARGISRDEITSEMVLAVMTGQPLAIEATATEA